ncbi:MAG: type II secretion system F family protein [Candidatus Aenigmarchaeota archaeon]|nr:type II secretion system F family protein [Candidatus Aenigmarchaeota archaeon]
MSFTTDLVEWYKNFSYKMFSSWIEKYLPYFESLKPDLKKANIKISLREYLSIAFMTSIMVFVMEFPFVFLITLFIPGFSVLMGFIFSFSLSMVFSVGIFFFFYIYPSMMVKERKRNIDFTLPFATLYLATISGGNVPPKSIFKILSRFKDYGEISREAKEITENIELFGMDITEALRKAAEKSPSEDFKELLWGISTTISSGGNLSMYLHEKANSFMQDYRRRMSEYSQAMSTMLEVYITLIIVGSIFFIVMSSMMSAFGLGANLVNIIVISQFLVIFIGLPLISTLFIIFLKKISPLK